MTTNIKISPLLATLFLMMNTAWGGNIKWAQTGFQFLSVPADARSAALAEATTALDMHSRSIFSNPACLAMSDKLADIALSRNSWIADIVHNNLSLALNPFQGRYGTIGLTYRGIDYGEIQGAAVSSANASGYILTDVFRPTANAIGLAYAKKLNDRFAVGGQISKVTMDFGTMVIAAATTTDSTTRVKYKSSPWALDFGTIYRLGIKSLQFGMSVRNFSEEIKYENESFQLPLAFTMGIAGDIVDFTSLDKKYHSLVISIDATHYRERPEQIKIGCEYTLLNFLALRMGYVTGSDENKFTLGAGIAKFGFAFDYAYIPFVSFTGVQVFTMRFEL